MPESKFLYYGLKHYLMPHTTAISADLHSKSKQISMLTKLHSAYSGLPGFGFF